MFDAFSRGRYSTDASIYQIEPIGVVVPRNQQDIIRAIQIAGDEGIPVLPRGGGTSHVRSGLAEEKEAQRVAPRIFGLHTLLE